MSDRTLILIGGLPGAGKTTLGHKFAQQTRGAVIDPDITRYAIARGLLHRAGQGNDPRLPDDIAPIIVDDAPDISFGDDGEHPWFYQAAVTQLTIQAMINQTRAAFSAHQTVIVPSAFVTAASRQNFIALGHEVMARTIKIWLYVDAATLEQRLQDRRAANPHAPGLHALHKAQEVFDPQGLEDWTRMDATGDLDDLCLDVVKNLL